MRRASSTRGSACIRTGPPTRPFARTRDSGSTSSSSTRRSRPACERRASIANTAAGRSRATTRRRGSRSPHKPIPAMPKAATEILVVDGHEVAVTNPHKVLFPQAGHTKLDVVRYFLHVAPGALRGSGGRPNILVRYPDGVDADFFYQKRAPRDRPHWLEVVTIRF